jgi:parallel beta-helix repeat protein
MNNSTFFNFSLSRLRHSLLDESNRAGYFLKHVLTLLFLFVSLYSSSKNYYVDPLAEASQQIGSEENPWVTLEQVTSATAMLLPGDTVFFRRGRTYIGKLNILASGAMNAPIVFTTYGSGGMPEFDNTVTHVIKMTDKQYVVIDGFKIIDRTVHPTDHSILANTTYAIVVENSPNCVIKNCDISLVGIGIAVSGNSEGTIVYNNFIHNLRMLRNTVGGNDDFGATGIVLNGSNVTVSKNKFEDCWGNSYDYLFEGGTVEFFGDTVSNNLIIYNTANNNNGFIKIGSIANGIAANNIVAYNKVINCGTLAVLQDTGLYKTRIKNIQFYNNNIVETVQQLRKPPAVFWMNGDGTLAMVVLKNNIFWLSSGINVASSKFDKGQMVHTNNIYRLSQGVVGLSIGGTEFFSPLSPLFTNTIGNPADWDYKLLRNSIAIDFGSPTSINFDFDSTPILDLPDAGVFEFDAPIILATLQNGKCFGDSGLVTIAAKGGTPPYTGIGMFAVSPGTTFFSVSDSKQKKDSVKVTINETPILLADVSAKPLISFNAPSEIKIIATGGTPPYSYSLNSGQFQSSAYFGTIAPGSYNILVRDDNACVIKKSIDIQPYEGVLFNPDQGSRFKVFPNPSNYQFTLDNLLFYSTSDIHLELYNMKGVLLYSKSGKFDANFIFGDQLPRGTYNVRIQVDSSVQNFVIVKL